MGRLVPYTAAMSRVLLGLECQEIVETEMNSQAYSEEPCSNSQQDENADPAAERRSARDAALAELSSRLVARAGGPSLSVEELREKCMTSSGEFCKYAVQLQNDLARHCERSSDYAPMDEMEEDEIYRARLLSAQRRFFSGGAGGGLSAAEIKKPKDLETMILATAHRLATRMRATAAASLRKSK